MGVPKNNLVCQAIFTWARLNGYLVAAQTSVSRTAPESAPPVLVGREEVLEAPALSSRERAYTPPSAQEALPSQEEPLETPPSPVPEPYATPVREASGSGRRRPLATPPPPPTPYFEEEEAAPPEEDEPPQELEEELEEEEEADPGTYAEAEAELPPTLYIEIPGEEAVAMEGDEFTIGRGKTCNFVIDSNRVSRQHACIRREGNNFILEDLNSSNGTFYGKHREKITRRAIVDGDEFIFGTERVAFYIQ